MIEVDRLSKRYGQVTVVEGLSFTVPDGSITGFLGPNGAGKSTTMRCLLGLHKPTTGTVLIDGLPLTAQTTARVSWSAVCPGNPAPSSARVRTVAAGICSTARIANISVWMIASATARCCSSSPGTAPEGSGSVGAPPACERGVQGTGQGSGLQGTAGGQVR